MGIRIGILGPLEVRDSSGRLLPVTGARLRSLLIRLAISDGRPVPVDVLAADLWPEGGPAAAGNALQSLVSRLRAVAGKDIVAYGPTGYRLAVPSGEIDAWAFERLVQAAARAAVAGGGSAADTLRQALTMWRGPALADVADAQFAAPAIARRLVPEIEQLATEHPRRC
jgi:two-component SAPR family response regulator